MNATDAVAIPVRKISLTLGLTGHGDDDDDDDEDNKKTLRWFLLLMLF